MVRNRCFTFTLSNAVMSRNDVGMITTIHPLRLQSSLERITIGVRSALATTPPWLVTFLK